MVDRLRLTDEERGPSVLLLFRRTPNLQAEWPNRRGVPHLVQEWRSRSHAPVTQVGTTEVGSGLSSPEAPGRSMRPSARGSLKAAALRLAPAYLRGMRCPKLLPEGEHRVTMSFFSGAFHTLLSRLLRRLGRAHLATRPSEALPRSGSAVDDGRSRIRAHGPSR